MSDNSIVYGVGDEKVRFVFRLEENGNFSAEVSRPRAPKRMTVVTVEGGRYAYTYRGPKGTEKKDPVATKINTYEFLHGEVPKSILYLARGLTKVLETHPLTTSAVFMGCKAMEETKPGDDFKEVLMKRLDTSLGKKKETGSEAIS